MIGYRTTFPRVEVIKLEQENNGVNSAAIVKGIRERAQPLPFGNQWNIKKIITTFFYNFDIIYNHHWQSHSR